MKVVYKEKIKNKARRRGEETKGRWERIDADAAKQRRQLTLSSCPWPHCCRHPPQSSLLLFWAESVFSAETLSIKLKLIIYLKRVQSPYSLTRTHTHGFAHRRTQHGITHLMSYISENSKSILVTIISHFSIDLNTICASSLKLSHSLT